jgi:DNA polymerase III sliding clamp (beta) subunit (PCNA family)
VPGKPLLDLLKCVSDVEVELESRRKTLKVTSGGMKAKLNISTDSVTDMPTASGGPIEVEDLSGLIVGMTTCVVGASKDELDGALCGVCVAGKYIYACDKFRIVRYELSEEVDLQKSIPVPFVKAIKNLGKNGGRLYCSSRLTFVSNDGAIITSSLLKGAYPDLSHMFPKSDPVKISFGGKPIVSSLEKHRMYQSGVSLGDQELEFMVTGTKCTILSEGDLGTLKEEVEIDADFGEEELGFFVNPALFEGVEKTCTSFDFYADEGVVMFTSGPASYLLRTRE